MSEDETRTLAALTTFLKDPLEPSVREQSGKIIKRMGDGWFLEFPNATDAVSFAVKIQTALSDHEVIQLRFGIHIGDVTIQDDDLYGRGVNIAGLPFSNLSSDPEQEFFADVIVEDLIMALSRFPWLFVIAPIPTKITPLPGVFQSVGCT